jgi:hypothetical protein
MYRPSQRAVAATVVAEVKWQGGARDSDGDGRGHGGVWANVLENHAIIYLPTYVPKIPTPLPLPLPLPNTNSAPPPRYQTPRTPQVRYSRRVYHAPATGTVLRPPPPSVAVAHAIQPNLALVWWDLASDRKWDV